MRRIGKGFSGVETPLFDTMLVQPQVQDVAKIEEAEDDHKVPAPHTPPSPTPPPPQQEPIPSPSQAQPAQSSSLLQQQPTQPADTSESSMTLLNTLMVTCATLTQKVSHLEQDKVAQALEIIKLKQRVRMLEEKRRSKSSGLKRGKLDADDDVTLVDVDVDIQGRMKEDVTAVKDINATEPTVFDDEESKLLPGKKQDKEDLERAKVLQQQYDQKQESINWNVVSKQMQEKHLDNIKKDEEPTKKRHAKETLIQENLKRLSAEVEVSGSYSTQQEETPTVDPAEISEEDVQNMLQIVLMAKFKVEALQVKYPLIDREIYSEGSRTYWRMIRVGGVTQAFQSFEDMLKDFDREDLDALWRITKEKLMLLEKSDVVVEEINKLLYVISVVRVIVKTRSPLQFTGQNGELVRNRSRGRDPENNKFVQDLDRRIKDEEKGMGSHQFIGEGRKFSVNKVETQKMGGQQLITDGVVNFGGNSMVAGNPTAGGNLMGGNPMVGGNPTIQNKINGATPPFLDHRRIEQKEKIQETENDDKRGDKRKHKDQDKQRERKDKKDKKEGKEEKSKEKSEQMKAERDKNKRI
nr:hypothetical protein [Tanacetum cinerariifolium]